MLLAACAAPPPPGDAAAAMDGGVLDAGVDAAHEDAARADAARADAALDAGAGDAGPGDAGDGSALDASSDDAAVLDAADAAEPDVGVDAGACGRFLGQPCDSSMISAPDCPFGFTCYGGRWTDMRASGVCLSAVGPRTLCDASGRCPGAFGGASTRCYLPYHFCLYAYEVACVCDDPAVAANCGAP